MASSWPTGRRGALTDITDQVNKSGLKGERDFWLPRWQESTFAGRIYALPWGADPNFAFLWNKEAFRKAGLPDRALRDIAELDDFNAKLMKFDGDRIVQVGLIPWDWDGDNSMFTWGYAFGGEFYKPPPPGKLTGEITANHPANVRALQWMAGYSKNYDVRRISAFRNAYPGVNNNPFILGFQAMRLFHVTEMTWLRKYGAHRLRDRRDPRAAGR